MSEQETGSQKLATKCTIVAFWRWNILRKNDALAVALIAIAVALLAASLPELLSGLRHVKIGSVQEVGVGEVYSRHPAVDAGRSTFGGSVREGVGDCAI